MTPVIDGASIEAAARRIGPYLPPTPMRRSAWLSERHGAEVYLKLECVQPTGSFKVRGAFAKLLQQRSLRPEGPLQAVAASTGNHGCAVAYALSTLGGSGVVFVPENAAANKVNAMKRYGVEVRATGDDGLDAEIAARQFASERGWPYVSPYNDQDVIAGQGTIAVEMERQVPNLDWVVASLGGGGLVGGMASWFKRDERSADQGARQITVVGCSPVNSCVMVDSVAAGTVLDQPSQPTLSDGTAGGVEQGAVTFSIVSELVDELVTVDEVEIERAVLGCLREEGLLIEGAAGVTIAAAEALGERLRGATVGIVLCGANIDSETISRLLLTQPS